MNARQKWIEMFGKPPQSEYEKLTVKLAELFDEKLRKKKGKHSKLAIIGNSTERRKL